jgi:Ca-activated chloride channel family protein
MNRPSALRFPFSIHTLLPTSTLAWALALTLALTLASASVVAADGIIIPQPPPDQSIPWRDIPLAIKYHRVDVTIVDQVATTKVDQVFVNQASFPVEGTYIFPLPEDAAISSFDMWVDGQKLEGKLLGRDEARAIYEDIVRRQRDPALLEYVGRGAFQASIFPIPPGGERRIELTYSQVLPQTAGLVHYRYPLNTEKFSSSEIEEVAVTVHLADKAPIRAIYSPSHPVEVVREGDRRATVSYEAQDVRPDRDFDLYYSLSTDTVAVNLLSYKPFDEDGFFLLLVTPPVEASGEVAAKDVVLVMDTSGSMDGEKIAQAKAAADHVLDHLGPNDRFNIVAFSTATRLFSDRPVPAARRDEGHAFVRTLAAAGSTDINRALLEALAGADAGRPTVLIFLTDGLPTAGEVDPDRIVANVADAAPKSARLFSFGVGYDVDTVLLDQLSSGQRGTSAYVKPEQSIEEEVSGFYARVSAPVLVDVAAAFSGVQVEDIYPNPLPDLFAGNQLVVAGRYRGGGPAELTLRGEVDGKPQAYAYRDLTFAERGGQEFIARLWAQRKIGYLLAQIRLHGVKDELVQEIVALSSRYGIVTPYTSFLVQEPSLALSQEGRDQLGRALQGLAPPGGRGGGSAGAPTAAPAAAEPLVGGDRSGQKAVEKAVAEQALQAAEQAAAPASAEEVRALRQVGDKTFLLSGGVWIDTAFDSSTMAAEAVAFGGERYFTLLAAHPEIGRYLALGDRVTVLLDGQAYAVAPDAVETSAGPTPASPPPTPVAPPLPTAVTPPETAAASPTVTLCPGAAAVGLMGVMVPLYLRRRH